MSDTPLDRAYLAMVAADDAMPARLAFFERLADAELFLVLENESDGASVRPMVMQTSDGAFALAFDTESRLADFAAVPLDYVAMAGRRVAAMLGPAGLGLSLNAGAGASESLYPAAVMQWLAEATIDQSQQTQAHMVAVAAPGSVPQALLQALDAKLSNMAGVASAAWFALASYDDDSRQHVLALVGVPPAAEPGVAAAIGEALRFAGLEGGALDVVFMPPDDPRLTVFARVGLGFEIPALILPEPPRPLAPGMDPAKPPKLR